METQSTLKALCRLLPVLSITFLVIIGCVAQERKDSVEKDILLLELMSHRKKLPNLQYTKSQIGDSIIINKEVLGFSKSIDELKTIAIIDESLTKDEVEEIFGKEYKLPIKGKEYWSLKQLPNIDILLFDGDKHSSAVTINKVGKKGLGTFNILFISKPAIRADKKYALIQTSNEHEGGVLHIYKKMDDGWVLYKDVQLYLI